MQPHAKDDCLLERHREWGKTIEPPVTFIRQINVIRMGKRARGTSEVHIPLMDNLPPCTLEHDA